MDVALPHGLKAAAACLALAACAAEEAPLFAEGDCEVVAVTDEQTGALIGGIEDAARLPDGDILLSAYDRRGTAAALRRGEEAPEGNLYRLSLPALLSGEVALMPLLPEGALGEEGFRPHGIDAADGRVAVVNRGVRQGRLAPRPVLFKMEDGRLSPVPTAEGRRPLPWCAANDVALLPEGLAISFDRAGCGGFRPLQLLGVPRGSLLAAGAVTEGLSFANGIAALSDGGIAVAETRGRRVRIVGGPRDGTVFDLPGAPDNLTAAANGELVAALQPSLFRFALYRYGLLDSVRSELVLIDTKSGATTRLYAGETLPGLTFGLVEGDLLIAGSVRDDGLLLCGGKAAKDEV